MTLFLHPHKYFKHCSQSRLLIFLWTAAALLAAPLPTLAVGDTPEPITLHPVTGFSTLGEAISKLVGMAIFLGALVTLVYLFIGAFKYVSAGDDASQTRSARTTITNAVIGLILLALVMVIFQVVIRLVPGLSDFFNVSTSGS